MMTNKNIIIITTIIAFVVVSLGSAFFVNSKAQDAKSFQIHSKHYNDDHDDHDDDDDDDEYRHHRGHHHDQYFHNRGNSDIKKTLRQFRKIIRSDEMNLSNEQKDEIRKIVKNWFSENFWGNSDLKKQIRQKISLFLSEIAKTLEIEKIEEKQIDELRKSLTNGVDVIFTQFSGVILEVIEVLNQEQKEYLAKELEKLSSKIDRKTK